LYFTLNSIQSDIGLFHHFNNIKIMKYTHRAACDKLAMYLYIIVSNHSVVVGVCVCVCGDLSNSTEYG